MVSSYIFGLIVKGCLALDDHLALDDLFDMVVQNILPIHGQQQWVGVIWSVCFELGESHAV